MDDRGFVLITGASRGLGRSIALDLARIGFSVFAGVRRTEDGDDLTRSASGDLRPLLLDVMQAAHIAAAEAQVRRTTGRRGLAALVNNAGVYALGPFEQTAIADVENLFRVNVFGLVAVTQAFLPMLRLARGRIVNISSINGKLSIPFSSFYSASKSAVEALSDALRVELGPWGITVSVIEPGAIATDIRARGAQSWAESRESLGRAARELYAPAHASLRDLIVQIDQGAADHHHVVDAVHRALTDESPQTRYLAGPDAPQWIAMSALEDRQRDAAFANLLAGSSKTV